ncbi:MAG TPA: tetratricopeptide repeat protein [Solirubrobacteraceae bacterium]|nr:tetratricopeptide repeat protein [Solirubrobacteraceae bacterium]
MRLLLRILPVAVVSFAATLAVLALGRDGSGAGPAPRHAAATPALPPRASIDQRIRVLQETVRAAPTRAAGYTLLAGAYLQKVRESGDASFYARAQQAVDRALRLDPADAGALTARGALALARHDFRAGLADARRARAIAPDVNKPFGVLVDALVELGRYREAGRALQAMVDRRPDLAAYARVSYFRELHGDLDGAVAAMRLAAGAGGDVPESDAYVRTLLGGLELQRGRVGAARREYRRVLLSVPGHPAAQAGLARVDVARGDLRAAIARLRRVVDRLPLPEHVIALGEAELAAGRTAAARRDLDVVRAEQRLLGRSGVNTDVELAVFEADHGRPERAVALARRAWASASSVRSADALGWALTRAGRAREALPWARRALALGSRDPSFLYHAGIAARDTGERELARARLRGAVSGRAALSGLHGARAARALEALR